MEVVLQQDFPQVGFIGERVTVKAGYARNYLIPNGIAVEASSKNARALKHRLAQINARRLKSKKEADQICKTLSERVLKFTLRIGESGKSYGSISNRDIEAQLKEIGYSVERRQITLAEPIKSAGDYSCSVKLHAEVAATVRLDVVAEAPLPSMRKEEPESADLAEYDDEEGEGEFADTDAADDDAGEPQS